MKEDKENKMKEDKENKMKEDKEYEKVKCEECNKYFYRISNTHLWKEHRMTIDDYKIKHPEALIEDKKLADYRVKHFKNKSYEEIYGNEISKQLKKQRTLSAINQMSDKNQIQIRKNKCGYEPTFEQKEKNMISSMIHGGNNYRKRALNFYGNECMRCGKTENLVVHHLDYNNDNSKFGNHNIENLMVLCKSCHASFHNKMRPGRFKGIDLVEKGAIYLLKGLQKEFGLKLFDDNFKDTPKRIARAFYEIFEGINCEEELKNICQTTFPSEYDGMVIVSDIKVFSMCPHHFLPVEYVVNVGYLPNKKTIGISKLSRVVELLAKAPELQEMFTKKISNILEKELEPNGVIVQVKGRHFCMVMRGVEKDSWTKTSSVTGAFKENKDIKNEFQLLLGK